MPLPFTADSKTVLSKAPSSVQLMAILNCTPDSFSDGGCFLSANKTDLNRILEVAQTAVAEGASLLDIGGESTRPGAKEVSVDEELTRVLPVVELLHRHLPRVTLSVDTRKAEVARQALAAGATMINDVSGLQFDSQMPAVLSQYPEAHFVLMHSQGMPETMQKNPHYPRGVVLEVMNFFERQIDFALQSGMSREQLILDPGFGFGKTRDHNLSLLRNFSNFKRLGLPLLAGLSRKGFLAPNTPAQDRDFVSVASGLHAITQGAQVLRVHNIAAHAQALDLAKEIAKEESL
jgi:dihydropteroate synthase